MDLTSIGWLFCVLFICEVRSTYSLCKLFYNYNLLLLYTEIYIYILRIRVKVMHERTLTTDMKVYPLYRITKHFFFFFFSLLFIVNSTSVTAGYFVYFTFSLRNKKKRDFVFYFGQQ